MNNINEELPGSQRRVTKKHCDPRILKRVRALFRKINRKRRGYIPNREDRTVNHGI